MFSSTEYAQALLPNLKQIRPNKKNRKPYLSWVDMGAGLARPLEQQRKLMKKNPKAPILSVPATIWDGSRQFSGVLELWQKAVCFRLIGFKNSHLELNIPITEIERVEEFLVFDLAKNGLRIQSKNGRSDLFVLDEGALFKNALLAQMGIDLK
jgi:hypothetical protein